MKDNLRIRNAKLSEINDVLKLYNDLLDSMDKTVNYPKWTKGVYPDFNYLEDKARSKELFILIQDGSIIGSSVLNIDRIKDYQKINWSQPELDESEILTIHTFAVKENLRGQGIGKKFINLIEEYALENGFKSIHLDTIYSNIPAVHFYENNDYKNLGQAELHYDETDETRFIMFEKDLI